LEVRGPRFTGILEDVVAFRRQPAERSEMTSFQDDDIETRMESDDEGGAMPSDSDDMDSADSDSDDADADSSDADADSTDPS
jgi:hypothetical protein